MQELKSSALSERPAFIADLVRTIREQRWPYFIEIVDKKFFLCMNMVTFQLLRPFEGSPEGERTNYVRNELAEYICRNAPPRVFEAFVAACNDPSDATLLAELTTLLHFAEYGPDEEGRGEALQDCIANTMQEYQEEGLETPEAYRRFLPSPDLSKRGKLIWLLPNLTSLTHIYARINLFEGSNLSNVALVHDEQIYFDEISQANKKIAESLGFRGAGLYTPHADFHFVESASLLFVRSNDSINLQVADVLAGFYMRYARAVLSGQGTVTVEHHVAFHQLIDGSQPQCGIGINHVTTTRDWISLSLSSLARNRR